MRVNEEHYFPAIIHIQLSRMNYRRDALTWHSYQVA